MAAGESRGGKGASHPPSHLRHLMVELEGCEPALLSDVEAVRLALFEAAADGGFRVVGCRMHGFSGGGVTGMLLLAESHMAVHTWPEEAYAALDIFTCSPEADPHAAAGAMARSMKAASTRGDMVRRGPARRRAASSSGRG